MLAVQIGLGIAGGILLAYFVIRNEREVLKFLASLLSLAGCLILIFAVGSGVSYGASSLDIGWPDIVNVVMTIVILAAYFGGGAGLVVLYQHFRPSIADEGAKDVGRLMVIGFVLLCIGNALLVDFAGWQLLRLLHLDGWWTSGNRWSRENGFADTFAVMTNAVGTLWPWLVVGVLHMRRPNGPENPVSISQSTE